MNTNYNRDNAHVAEQHVLQGDVAGSYIPQLPEGAVRVQSTIVAHGEVTGHHHIVEKAEMYRDRSGTLFALIKEPTLLLHHQHAPWALRPGVIQFGEKGQMQVEYSGEEERAARD
jgi:hypothetical protein